MLDALQMSSSTWLSTFFMVSSDKQEFLIVRQPNLLILFLDDKHKTIPEKNPSLPEVIKTCLCIEKFRVLCCTFKWREQYSIVFKNRDSRARLPGFKHGPAPDSGQITWFLCAHPFAHVKKNEIKIAPTIKDKCSDQRSQCM